MYEFKIKTFPKSEKFYIFKVYLDRIFNTVSPKVYNIGNGEIGYALLRFDDPITVELIIEILNNEEVRLNG